jgi:hypothetical protein
MKYSRVSFAGTSSMRNGMIGTSWFAARSTSGLICDDALATATSP